MTSDTHLAIDCQAFGVIGSFGEAMWGRPKTVESDADLGAWVRGLRKDGGAG